MDLNFSTLMGGGAIFATVALLWQKIKWVWERISSIVFVTYTIEHYKITIAVNFYLSKHFSLLKFQPRIICGETLYVRPRRKYGLVGFEWNRMKSIYISKKGVVVFGMSSSGNKGDVSNAQITTIRGLIELKQLITDAIDEYNSSTDQVKQRSSNQSTRFKIIQYCGQGRITKNNKTSDGGYSEDSKGPIAVGGNNGCGIDNSELLSGKIEFLKWTINDIGEEDKQNAGLKNLALPPYVDGLIEEANRWMDSQLWFEEKGIPWRRGWLLHGKPGTGKSSLIKAIGQHLRIPICLFDIASMGNNEFNKYWEEMLNHTPCIALIEDIDAVFSGRTNKLGEMGGGLTFDCLLNCMSGVKSADGVFLIITSNHIEDIDEALGKPRTDKDANGTLISTRPGRIDRVFALPLLDDKCRLKIANRILCDCPSYIEKTVKDGDGDTGAQFQERCAQIALRAFWDNKSV